MSAGDAALPRIRPEIVLRPAGAEALVHDPVSGRVHVLNALAARILGRLDGTTALAAIVDEIVAATGAPRERVRADVDLCYEGFIRNGLIR